MHKPALVIPHRRTSFLAHFAYPPAKRPEKLLYLLPLKLVYASFHPLLHHTFAKVVVITVEEVHLTVVEALRKSRAFMSLMKKRNIPVARLMWAYSSEFDEVRDRK